MATYPKTLPAGAFKVYLGDGAEPEVFAQPCGFTDKALNMTATATDTVVPPCPPDDDEAAWTERSVTALSAEVTGSGVLAMGGLATWRAWYLSGQSKNIRVEFDSDPDGGYWQGAAILTAFNHTAARGGKAQVSVTMPSDGPWVWVDA